MTNFSHYLGWYSVYDIGHWCLMGEQYLSKPTPSVTNNYIIFCNNIIVLKRLKTNQPF